MTTMSVGLTPYITIRQVTAQKMVMESMYVGKIIQLDIPVRRSLKLIWFLSGVMMLRPSRTRLTMTRSMSRAGRSTADTATRDEPSG